MTSPQFGEPGYTPGAFDAVKAQVQPPPVGTGPAPDDISAKVPLASATETDVNALIATMQAQMAAMQQQISTLKSSQGPEGEHCLIGAATQARDLIAHHFEFHPKGPELVRLADDVVDAARNAVSSGDTGAARQVAGKLGRQLDRYNPGPGDHHYFRQAYGLVTVHIPDSADTITEAAPSGAPAVGSSHAPARVLQGSVTG